MSVKPFRNSKGADQPYRSPFSTPKDNNVKSNDNTPNRHKTPLKAASSRRLHFQQVVPTKRQCLDEVSDESKNTADVTKLQLVQDNLDTIRKRIKQKQETIDNLKRILLYKRKNKAEDLEAAIEKWTTVCQEALQDYYEDRRTKFQHELNMYQFLSKMGIDPKLVRYSIENETFC